MMILILFAIWAFGLFVLFTDPKSTYARWGSATAFVGGGGFFSSVIDETLFPLLQDYAARYPALAALLLFTSRSASFLCQVGLPYTYLMFAVHSGDWFTRKTKRLIQYAALVPPLVMWAITPIYPVLAFNYWIMVAWVFPYFIAASLMLVLLYLKEKDPLVKKSRLFTNILVIIPLLLVFILIYVMRTQNLYDAWRYNTLVVGIQFFLILFISVKYGFLGVKLRVEKRRLDSTLRAMTSGAQIVNHTIKNEVGKILLYADRIQTRAAETNQPALMEDARILSQSAQHILNMANRIQGQLQDIVLREETVNPSEVIAQVLHTLKPGADEQHVQIVTELDETLRLTCDRVQLREILTNLCMNALEAMKAGGTLTLQLFLSNKHLVIAVADTGVGIAQEHLPYVFDPFFSTKKTGQNFGLGLSYCYNVMQKHQGMMEIYSVKDQGTTVFLFFPRRRVARAGRAEAH
ncbi:HAMP domain-containing sensor histidine kinase [Brevibacillus sp. MCWH]|uniref:sensor histidine kinase n=1 Tax=Brevibacillus sp. MCWH TaxID=2508871 RepID=UPI001492992D|nr:HAMP domain-containing sensor histidine kinase [Brevibacillus sp. MCWH]NNV01153.1 HAMP domain-containing histidine kinase [Brevibacillus sp. MCWH]